jgi:hypothetical protein
VWKKERWLNSTQERRSLSPLVHFVVECFRILFSRTFISISVKIDRRLGQYRSKLVGKQGRQNVILKEGNDIYLTFFIPKIPLTNLHFTLVYKQVCMCITSVYVKRTLRQI